MSRRGRQDATAACTAFFCQKGHQLFELYIARSAEQGAALSFLANQAGGHKRRKVMAERGRWNAEALLQFADRQAIMARLNQLPINAQSCRVS